MRHIIYLVAPLKLFFVRPDCDRCEALLLHCVIEEAWRLQTYHIMMGVSCFV